MLSRAFRTYFVLASAFLAHAGRFEGSDHVVPAGKILEDDIIEPRSFIRRIADSIVQCSQLGTPL
jgi:hypothetical protein